MAFHNKGYFKRIRRGFTLKSRKIGQFQPFFLHFLDFDWPKNQIFKNRRPGYRLPIFSPILILCLGYRSRFYVCFRLARSISISCPRHTCTHFHYGVTPSSFSRLTPDKPREKSARVGVGIGVVMEKQELRGVMKFLKRKKKSAKNIRRQKVTKFSPSDDFFCRRKFLPMFFYR